MYKILICMKDKSLRCNNKNQNLIRYIIDYLYLSNYYNDVVIITDSEFICNIAKSRNINYYKEQYNNDSELISAYNYIKNYNNINEIILLPVTQPLREINLLENIIKEDISNYDFITSKVIINDRSIFYIDDNDNFLIKSDNRKGCLCKSYYMIDGAIYKINKDFLKNVVESSDSNKYFWGGKFKTILNTEKFFDIDTPKDYIEYIRFFTNKKQLLVLGSEKNKLDIDYINLFDKVIYDKNENIDLTKYINKYHITIDNYKIINKNIFKEFYNKNISLGITINV